MTGTVHSTRQSCGTAQDDLTASNGVNSCSLRAAALGFDWDNGDLKRLSWIMSKVGVDLATAVQVFLNGDPQRFNHLATDEVPLDQNARVAMLDCLHMKISYGFYLPEPKVGLAPVRAQADLWIAQQKADRAAGTRGRWVFNEAHFDSISDQGPQQVILSPVKRSRSPIWKTLFVPMWVRS